MLYFCIHLIFPIYVIFSKNHPTFIQGICGQPNTQFFLRTSQVNDRNFRGKGFSFDLP